MFTRNCPSFIKSTPYILYNYLEGSIEVSLHIVVCVVPTLVSRSNLFLK